MPQDILRVILTHSVLRGPSPYLLYTIFDRKIFVYLLLTNGTPFTDLV